MPRFFPPLLDWDSNPTGFRLATHLGLPCPPQAGLHRQCHCLLETCGDPLELLSFGGASACAWDYSAPTHRGSTELIHFVGRIPTLAFHRIGCAPRPIGQIPRWPVPATPPAAARATQSARVRVHPAQARCFPAQYTRSAPILSTSHA